jgi:hypothetical protein
MLLATVTQTTVATTKPAAGASVLKDPSGNSQTASDVRIVTITAVKQGEPLERGSPHEPAEQACGSQTVGR